MADSSQADSTLLPPRSFNQDQSRHSIATTASADPSFKAPLGGLDSSAAPHSSAPVEDYPYPETTKPKNLAVIVPVYLKVIKPNYATENSSSSGSSTTKAASPTATSGGNPTDNLLTAGGDGSKITKDDGTTFTYTNKFGGYWVWDPKNPYNNSARAQSWSPPLNQVWNYGVDQIRGVNLGGWLVLEPWIVPAMYEPYQPSTPGYTGIQAVDEYTLSQAIAANASSGGLAKVMEDHYKTFITEEDFAMIAGAGLNWVRILIPFWAVSKFDDEPYLEGVAWNYFLKAIDWARKYGLRINVDLHTIPGSQNGYDHSGKLGTANWMHGVMGIANGQRALNIMRSIVEFISRDEIKDVVPMFGVLNEPPTQTIGIDAATSFYLEMHDMIRNITGPGKGPFISIHDGFDTGAMDNFLPGSDRIAMDSHVYFAFDARLSDAPLAEQVQAPCTRWGSHFNTTLDNWGFVTAGEWSLGFNDCAYYLNGAERGYRYDGTLPSYGGPRIGPCDPCMDAMQNYFFWTWRVGESSRTGKVNSPLWSYKLGLQNGWMPNDPREAAGQCGNSNPRTSTRNYTPGTPTTISDTVRAAHPFPPAALADQADAAVLPRYTPTGMPRAMPAATYADATVAAPTPTVSSPEWRDYVPIQGCTYPDQWNAVDITVPTQCTGA